MAVLLIKNLWVISTQNIRIQFSIATIYQKKNIKRAQTRLIFSTLNWITRSSFVICDLWFILMNGTNISIVVCFAILECNAIRKMKFVRTFSQFLRRTSPRNRAAHMWSSNLYIVHMCLLSFLFIALLLLCGSSSLLFFSLIFASYFSCSVYFFFFIVFFSFSLLCVHCRLLICTASWETQKDRERKGVCSGVSNVFVS